MKTWSLLLIVMCLFADVWAQKVIRLDAPDKNRGLSVMKALEQRKSDREFSEKKLSLQDLSDLVWAANGVNRPESGKRTAPSAMNRQDIEVYVCMTEGTYRYEAGKHELHLVTEGDCRPAVAGGQAFVEKAPVCLVLVSDLSKFGGDEQQRKLTGAMDAGIVSQNVALFCAGVGLVTVPRMSMDQAQLRKALKLTKDQYLMLNLPVGYKK